MKYIDLKWTRNVPALNIINIRGISILFYCTTRTTIMGTNFEMELMSVDWVSPNAIFSNAHMPMAQQTKQMHHNYMVNYSQL